MKLLQILALQAMVVALQALGQLRLVVVLRALGEPGPIHSETEKWAGNEV